MEFHHQTAVALNLLMVIFLGFSCSISQSRTFYVGEKDGWVPNPSENYNHWAERNRFQINDSLVFKYKQGLDSVLEVSRDDYYTCKKQNPKKTLKDGESEFKFQGSGPFYFISGYSLNCEKGQKLFVVVMSPRRHASPPPTMSSPVPQPSMSPYSFHSPSPSPSPSHYENPPVESPAPASALEIKAPAPAPAPAPYHVSVHQQHQVAPAPATATSVGGGLGGSLFGSLMSLMMTVTVVLMS